MTVLRQPGWHPILVGLGVLSHPRILHLRGRTVGAVQRLQLCSGKSN